MKENFKEYLRIRLQKSVPFVLSLLFILLENVEPKLGIRSLQPMFGLMCVFFWVFNRPDIFGVICVGLLGIAADLLEYAPLGLFLFTFLLIYVVEIKIAKYISNKIFVVNWVSFAVLSLLAVLLQWVIVSLFIGRALCIGVILGGWLITICLYPLVAAINIKVAGWLMKEEFE